MVDSEDQEIGRMEKLEAHTLGMLHRAISVIVINSKGEILLQRRALDKYHSPGLWTNTCCSHPYPGEATTAAAGRRLNEEMGMSCQPEFLFKFEYRTRFNNGLIEHEMDHVYVCYSDETPTLNPCEAIDWKYMSLAALKADISNSPQRYTYWFKRIIERLSPVTVSNP